MNSSYLSWSPCSPSLPRRNEKWKRKEKQKQKQKQKQKSSTAFILIIIVPTASVLRIIIPVLVRAPPALLRCAWHPLRRRPESFCGQDLEMTARALRASRVKSMRKTAGAKDNRPQLRPSTRRPAGYLAPLTTHGGVFLSPAVRFCRAPG